MVNHRHSLRRLGHDYAAGSIYFVTFCTAHREALLGRVVEHRVHLSPFGRLVAEIGFEVVRTTTNATLVSAIIMPDHVHAIIFACGIRSLHKDVVLAGAVLDPSRI